MLAAGEKQRVASEIGAILESCDPSLNRFYGNTTLDCRAGPYGLREQNRIEPMARNGKRRARQSGFSHIAAGKQPDPGDLRLAKPLGFDAKVAERIERAPAQEAAAQGVTGLVAPFHQQMRQSGASEQNRRARPGRPAANDQRSASTHNRNGKAR